MSATDKKRPASPAAESPRDTGRTQGGSRSSSLVKVLDPSGSVGKQIRKFSNPAAQFQLEDVPHDLVSKVLVEANHGAKKYLMYSCTGVDEVAPNVPSTDEESMVEEGGTDRVTTDLPHAGQRLTVEEDGTDLEDVDRFRRGHVVIDRDWLMCHEARKFKHRLVMYDDGKETLELRLPQDSLMQTLGVFTCGKQSYAPDDKIGRFVGSLLRQGTKDIVDQHPLYKEYGMEAEVDDTVYHVVPGSNYAFGLMHFVNGADYKPGDGRKANVTAEVEHDVNDNKVSIIFKALEDIKPETELLVNYGSEYYGDRLTEDDLELTKG